MENVEKCLTKIVNRTAIREALIGIHVGACLSVRRAGASTYPD